MIDTIKQYAKFAAAILGAVAVSFAGLIPDGWAPWIQAVIALATAISVLAIPNQITDAQIARSKGVTLEQYLAQQEIAALRARHEQASVDSQA